MLGNKQPTLYTLPVVPFLSNRSWMRGAEVRCRMDIFHPAALLGISVVGSKVFEPGIIHWYWHGETKNYPRWRIQHYISQSSC